MEWSKKIVAPIVLAVFLQIAGCASSGQQSSKLSASGPIQRINSCLVMKSDLMLELDEAAQDDAQPGWEVVRNDPSWPQEIGIPDFAAHNLIERNYRQRLRITNGRSREYSNFSTRVREHRHPR
jgi:hypothetical protein